MRTTIEVAPDKRRIWRQWCKKFKLSSVKLFDKLIEKIEQRQQQEFYNSLPRPIKYVKPLENKRIRKFVYKK